MSRVWADGGGREGVLWDLDFASSISLGEFIL